ncbi:MAG: SRPBCC family protein [Anaerolineales bacterium]
MTTAVATTVTMTVAVPRVLLFDWFIPVELPKILLGYGPLPGVVRTEGQTGPWNQAGSRRKVHLADRSTAEEEVTACEAPQSFAYRVSGFTHPLFRALVAYAVGQWQFQEANDQTTSIEWVYTFHGRSPLAALLLRPVVKFLWHGYMLVGLRAFKTQAEKELS